VGIIRENLYIDLKSENHALILNDGQRWNSTIAPKPEVVILFDNKVWSPQALPEPFDLSDAVVVSFEATKVRFLISAKCSPTTMQGAENFRELARPAREYERLTGQ
jgi:hypothetical protein